MNNLLAAAGREAVDESVMEFLSEQKPINEMEWEAIKRFHTKDSSGVNSENEFQEVKRRKKARKKQEQKQKTDSGDLNII